MHYAWEFEVYCYRKSGNMAGEIEIIKFT